MVNMAPPLQAKGSPLAWAISVLNYLPPLSNLKARVAAPPLLISISYGPFWLKTCETCKSFSLSFLSICV